MAERPHRPIRAAESLTRAAKAVRSGFRRYPRAILESVFDGDEHPASPGTMPDLGPHALALSWVGHASVLCRIDGVQLVVDPVFSNRIGPRILSRTVGPRRLVPAPVRAEDLRGLDVVLITHAHYDHLDRPTLQALAHPRTRVLTAPGCVGLVPPGYANVSEIRTGETRRIASLSIGAIEPRHWGARSVFDRYRGVCAYLVESRGRRVLFAGDTAMTDAFDNLGPLDVAVFGIGAYEPWEHMHATPEQVWAMFRASGARYLLPVHHATFELSDEPPDEPMRRLKEAAGDEASKILDTGIGEVVVIDPDPVAAGTRGQPDPT